MESKGIAFPNNQTMRLYASIWDGEDWATQGGGIKTNWTAAPFTASFKNFKGDACIWSSTKSASSPNKGEEPVLGIPYNGGNQMMYHPQTQPQPQFFYVGENPYQNGAIPPNAIFDDPKGVPIHQTFYRDTPAPFSCVFCGHSSITSVKSKPSLAAVVGCMMPFMLGFCFLCPSMDCLWHKYHYCPKCGEKVADFEKSDPCIVMDPPNWVHKSFALTG
ncbi:unnamed protein product [Amaranthus hypochondriacus]